MTYRARLALALLPLLLAACESPPPPPVEVRYVKTLVVHATTDAGASREYSGEVRARYESVAGFRVGGKIIARLVDAGASVKAGQALAKLDPSDAVLQSTQAEAQRTLADAEAKRYRDLRARNFISQSALDAKETTLQAAAAQAGLARNQANYTTLFADQAGVVAEVLAEPGQVVATGQGVLRMARDGERDVLIQLPESAIGTLKIGDPAELRLWSDTTHIYHGKLREIAGAADPATRTFVARIAISDADAKVGLGMTATARFVHDESDPIVIPIASIFQQGDHPAVWMVDKNQTISLRNIEIERYGDAGATVKSGLQDGDLIVAAGVHKLATGEKVKLVASGQK